MRSVLLGYAIWLYGSHSRGVVDEFSDIDVLFVSGSDLEDKVVYDFVRVADRAINFSVFLGRNGTDGRVRFSVSSARCT